MLEIEISDLGQEGFALTGDIAVPPGITAVMGPSGAGKSTLLSVISGFWQPEQGDVLWRGQPITDLPPGQRPVAILFQDNNLFPHLTLAQNVALALGSGRRTPAQTTAVRDALGRVGLDGLQDRKPGQLSGGQQSRAALARVLLQDRPIVLLDEPFAALGPALKAEMLQLVARILAGRTVLMVSHDPADARAVADAVIVVADGLIQPPAPVAQTLDNPPPALAEYLGR